MLRLAVSKPTKPMVLSPATPAWGHCSEGAWWIQISQINLVVDEHALRGVYNR
jgi:hypothetical protein